jgi:hypothetical protein
MLASLCAKTDEQSVNRLSRDGSMDDQKTSLPTSARTGGLHKVLPDCLCISQEIRN